MRIRRWLRYLGISAAVLVVVLAAITGGGWIYFHPPVERTNGIVYGMQGDVPLTMDVFQPESGRANGLGIALMVSGGWKSKGPGKTPVWLVAPLIRAGYTVFGICHISQPTATILEIAGQMQRGIRFIRHNAKVYAIDPNRIGVTGGSSGGHLALMLATRGGPGSPGAADPVDRESSAVQAVAIFYPPTDMLNLGPSTENLGDGGPPKSFVRAFGPGAREMSVWRVVGRESSPIYFIHPNLPPILIYHGDADTLVPLEQSERFQRRAEKMGNKVKLVVHHGGKHGWLTMILDERDFVRWFDRYLGNPRG
ncbi:MAG: alpha/beta hydrolase [Bryobacterales bacterium]|nr:alpha/beta hydrolase [Bryobacterales bacterium]